MTDRWKLASDKKSTVEGNEFYAFTTLSSSSSSSLSSTMDAGEMPLCPHLVQLVIITYTYKEVSTSCVITSQLI